MTSNRFKNDSRIFEHPQGCSSSDSERGFGKEKVGCTFCSTLLDTRANGEIESHLAKTLSRWSMTTIIFKKIIKGDETWCFAYDTETKRQNSEWVGETSPRPKKLKFQRSHIKTILIIFSTLKALCTKNSYRSEKQ